MSNLRDALTDALEGRKRDPLADMIRAGLAGGVTDTEPAAAQAPALNDPSLEAHLSAALNTNTTKEN